MLKRGTRWLIACCIAAIAVAVTTVSLLNLPQINMRLTAWRAEAIAYGELRGADGSDAVIREIWKQAKGPEQLRIGGMIYVGPNFAPGDPQTANAVILFFDNGSSREFHRLRGSTRVFFRAGRFWWDGREFSVSEAKALCGGNPST